mmetsp:Transcript_20080/g.43812  ORF Transcript_20080/g.43812 Transcript_20080/m.43812 type:complete len:420 (+) Transcript_20080:212-1471(+)
MSDDSIPDTASLLAAVKETHSVKSLHQNFPFLKSDAFSHVIWDVKIWDAARDELLVVIKECTAAKASQVKTRKKKYSHMKLKLRRKFTSKAGNSYKIPDANENQIVQCRCFVLTLYLRFIEELERRIVYRNVEDLRVQIEKAYNKKDDEQVVGDHVRYESLYYIAGYLLQAAKKNGETRGDTEIGRALALFAESAAHGNDPEDIPDGHLPTGMTTSIEHFNGLMYPREEFFELIVRVETVFSNCINGLNFCASGSFLVRKICIGLVNTPDVTNTFSSLLPAASKEVIRSVTLYMIRTYGRMRGKDATRKMNSVLKRKKAAAMATRARLAVTAENNINSKKKKKKGRGSKAKAKAAAKAKAKAKGETKPDSAKGGTLAADSEKEDGKLDEAVELVENKEMQCLLQSIEQEENDEDNDTAK